MEAREDLLLPEHLPPEVRAGLGLEDAASAGVDSLRQEMAGFERLVLDCALVQAGGNRTKAASLLGIHRTGLYHEAQASQLGAWGQGMIPNASIYIIRQLYNYLDTSAPENCTIANM